MTSKTTQVDQNREDDCYCVCHSPVSSRAFCEHCNGNYLKELQEESSTRPMTLRQQLVQILDFNTDENSGGFSKDLRDYYENRIVEVCEQYSQEIAREAVHTKLKYLNGLFDDELRGQANQWLSELTQKPEEGQTHENS